TWRYQLSGALRLFAQLRWRPQPYLKGSWIGEHVDKMDERDIGDARIDISVVRDEKRKVAGACHLFTQGMARVANQVHVFRDCCIEGDGIPSTFLCLHTQPT